MKKNILTNVCKMKKISMLSLAALLICAMPVQADKVNSSIKGSSTGFAASINPTRGDESPYTVTQTNEEDYSFIIYNLDDNNNLIKTYYKINTIPSKLSNLSDISFSKQDSSSGSDFTIVLPNNFNEYYKYTLNSPENVYTNYSNGVFSNYSSNIVNKIFITNSKIGGSTSTAQGGVIKFSNTNYYNNISGIFIKNYASGGQAIGGCIFIHDSKVNDINAIFISNYVTGNSTSSDSEGGAIEMQGGSINSINGAFIGNNAKRYSSKEAFGGAIRTYYSSIGPINADFIGNYTYSSSGLSYGGAITNAYATLGNITGDFIGNSSRGYQTAGGAIAQYTSGKYSRIGDITGNFIGNYLEASNYGYGGAFYARNDGSYNEIGTITGYFANNYINAGTNAFGGAVYNGAAKITFDDSKFVGNYATAQNGNALGGAIYNTKTINSIKGDFIANHADTKKISYKAFGGAIYNGGNISSNTPSYSSNAVITLSDSTFSKNYVDNNGTRIPNGVYNAGIINIQAGKTVTVNDGWQSHNSGRLVMGASSTLNLNIANGIIQSDSLGQLTNAGTINTKLDVDFSDLNNPLADTITVTSATQSGKINITELNFVNGSIDDFKDHLLKVQILKNADNSSNLQLELAPNLYPDIYGGEVILKQGEKTSHSDDFNGNANWSDVYTTYDLATDIYGTIGLAKTDTTNDSIGVTVTREVQNKTNIQTQGDTLKLVNQFTSTDTDNERSFTASTDDETYTVKENIGTTSSGKLTVQGIYTPASENNDEKRSTIDFDSHSGFVLDNDNTELVLKNVEVKGASALVSATGTSTENKLVLDNANVHDNGTGILTYGDIEIKGHSKVSDDMIVLGSTSTTDIDGTDEVTLDSRIIGLPTNQLNLTNGTINLTDRVRISPMNAKLTDVNLNIANENSLTGLNTDFNGSNNLNIANGSIGTLALGNVDLNGLLKMQVDADLANKSMDTLTATSASVNGGSIDVTKINILSPTTDTTTSLLFTNNPELANVVSYSGEGTIVYSPIYKYKTSYETKDGQGYFNFVIPSSPDPKPGPDPTPGPSPSPAPTPSDFNPAIIASPVATNSSAQVAMEEAFGVSFNHADTFMPLPASERFALINKNVYSLNENNRPNGISTDFNNNMGHIDYDHTNRAIWVKPYTSFERINFKNGPKTDIISYGTIIGGDSDFHKLKHGWANIATAYIGYNGSQINYNNVDITTNGGLLGLTETFYKKNFFTALSVQAGAGVAQAHTMYGRDDITSLMAGIASKTGYNLEFKDGKFIIQPNLMINYSMIHTFDYTNAAGVRIDSKPLHNIQINPTLRFVANLKNEWQPYASVGMVWNVLNETETTANGVKLPEMQIKPYVEYGVGIQKHIGDRFSGFGQAMVRNGGRNGIALSLGFRWALGDISHNHNEKVQIPLKEKVVKHTKEQPIKQTKEKSTKIAPSKNINKTNKLSKKQTFWAKFKTNLNIFKHEEEQKVAQRKIIKQLAK